jgi:hypothetical protein
MRSTESTTYDLSALCATIRDAFTTRGVAGLREIERGLSDVLRDPAFVAATFDESMTPGKRELAFEPVTGAYVLAHVHEPGRAGAPHSHGTSWAVYGTARGATGMTDWERVDDGEPGTAVTACAHYTLGPGETHAYHSGMLHSTEHAVPTWVVRITGGNLDEIPRYRFDRRTDRIVSSRGDESES